MKKSHQKRIENPTVLKKLGINMPRKTRSKGMISAIATAYTLISFTHYVFYVIFCAFPCTKSIVTVCNDEEWLSNKVKGSSTYREDFKDYSTGDIQILKINHPTNKSTTGTRVIKNALLVSITFTNPCLNSLPFQN